MYLAFINNQTGFTAIHSWFGENPTPESKTSQKKRIKAFYDRLHGKGVYSFFIAFAFFKPFTHHIVHPNKKIIIK